MLTLGHIIYSNCFPVHSGIVTKEIPFPFRLVEGIPTDLNRMLFEGGIDVSPSSSIEFARNPGRYVIMPDFSISCRQKAMSIILKSGVPLDSLEGKVVALTTASATSVVLLRIILEMFHGIHPTYIQFKQGKEDPFEKADAALFIGDLALQTTPAPNYPHLFDLGALWHQKTGLPFVFALWQVNRTNTLDKDLAALYDILVKSRAYGLSQVDHLAAAYADTFQIPSETLKNYWNSFSFHLGEPEQEGLLTYYRYAAELGIIKPVEKLRFWNQK